MNDFGEMSATGVVLSDSEMKERRLKRGECVTCGIKCFKKTLFKTIPISENGKVLNGRCLQCRPLDANEMDILPAQVEIASERDLRRANKSMGNLGLGDRSPLRRNSGRMMGRALNRRISNDSKETTIRRSVSDGQVIRRSSIEHQPLTLTSLQEETPGKDVIINESIRASAPFTTHTGTSKPETNTDLPETKEIPDPSMSDLSPNHEKNESKEKARSDSKSEIEKTAVALAASLHLQRNFREKRGKKHSSSESELPPLHLQPTSLDTSDEKKKASTLEPKASGIGTQDEEEILKAIQPKPSSISNQDEEEILIALSEKNIPGILEIALEYPHSSNIQKKATQLLSQFMLTAKLVESDIDALVNCGGIHLLVTAVKTLGKDEEEMVSICTALCNVSNSDKVQTSLGKHGAIESIVKVMENFDRSEKIQFLCVECLRNICTRKENASRLREIGGEKKIIQTMSSYSDSTNLQELCIDTIIKFSRVDSLLNALLAGNCADQVSISMVIFSSDLNILRQALRALQSLSRGGSLNQRQIADSGAIDSIVSTMHLHRDNPIIQSEAALTLGVIGMDLHAAKCIGECGGIDLITRALFAHTENVDVTEKSIHALNILSKYSGNHSLMVEIGVIKAAIQVLQTQTDHVTIQMSCLETLSNVCRDRMDVKVNIVEEEALDSISMSMMIHADDRKLQQSACCFLYNVACDATLNSLLVIGVTELMTQASQRFPNECMEYTDQVLTLIQRIL